MCCFHDITWYNYIIYIDISSYMFKYGIIFKYNSTRNFTIYFSSLSNHSIALIWGVGSNSVGVAQISAPSWWAPTCSSMSSLGCRQVFYSKICVSLWWQAYFLSSHRSSLMLWWWKMFIKLYIKSTYVLFIKIHVENNPYRASGRASFLFSIASVFSEPSNIYIGLAGMNFVTKAM